MSEWDEESTPERAVAFDGETLTIDGHSWPVPITIATEPVRFDVDSDERTAPYDAHSFRINGTLVTAALAMCAVRALGDWEEAKERP